MFDIFKKKEVKNDDWTIRKFKYGELLWITSEIMDVADKCKLNGDTKSKERLEKLSEYIHYRMEGTI